MVKMQTLLYGYRQLHCSCKSRWYLWRYCSLNKEIDRPLPIGKNENVIGLMKEELGGQIMKKFVGLKAKTNSYLKDNNDEDKKAKGTKRCVIKRKLKFKDYKKSLKVCQTENVIKYLKKKEIDVDCLKEDKNEFVKNKLILKAQKWFKSERHNVFTEEINKIALSSNYDERLWSIDSIETYAHGMSKGCLCKKQSIKHSIIKQYQNDYITREELKEHKPNWPEIPHHPYRILITGGSGSGKTNALINLINHDPDIDKIYLYVIDPYKAKYYLLINKRENIGLKYFNDLKAFIEYSNDMDDVCKNIEEYNPNKKRKKLIVFDDMIADILSNKKCKPSVTELFIRGRKLNISRVFIKQ